MDPLPIVPVVLAGGSGTRLWPMSRLDAPKQLLPLLGGKTMLRATIERSAEVTHRRPPIVVCNAAHADVVRSELDAAGEPEGHIVVEPVGRNTAPAVGVAARLAAATGDSLLLVMPADHLITDVAAFTDAVATGRTPATEGDLVTFGITPTYPATGYGYIRSSGDGVVRHVDAFVEKPDRATAEAFLETANHLWNSGMFLFRADRYLSELERFEPAVAAAVSRSIETAHAGPDGNLFLDSAEFAASPSISIDYAVMERTASATVVALDAGWSDIGSWASLAEATEADAEGNALIGDVVVQDAVNAYIRSDGPLVVASHVRDVVIVATPDAVLVTDRHHSESVRDLVGLMRAGHRPEADESATHIRPWGRLHTLSRTSTRVVDRLDIAGEATVRPAPGTWLVLAGSAAHGDATLAEGDFVEVGDGAPLFRNELTTPLVMLAVTSGGAET